MSDTGKTAEQLDADVKAAEAELEARAADREKIVERLVAALVPLVQASFDRMIASIVVEESEVTTKLGPQLSLIKQKLKSVAATIPEQVKRWVAHDHWQDRFANRSNNTYAPISWKLDPQGHRVRVDDRNSLQLHVEKMLTFFVRETMSNYGYKAPHHYGVSWIGEPTGITSEYENALVEFENARLRHQAAVTERQRFEAKLLWDKA
ncbi:MAG: hypothetical protein JWP01_3981 [Myxococcales bacterium]|nr:hypothetical protein [Myxococcales bacterium]